MTLAKREDERLLSKEEQELVAQTRHPTVTQLTSDRLSQVVAQIRERRNIAREIGRYRRRGFSGQTMTTDMDVGHRSHDGQRAKRTLLSAALKRANKETERRRIRNARLDLISNAKRALSMKKHADTGGQWPPETRTANEGMHSIPNMKGAPSGALKQEGQRPVLERSRKVR